VIVPTIRCSRMIAVPPEVLWETVADPHHLPRWWPRVARVEGVADRHFTEVLQTDKGKSVRADFTVLESTRPSVRRWAQAVENTPFERILAAAETEIRLVPDTGGTRVTLTLRQRLRGLARLGGFLVRGATRRQLDEALSSLESLHGD
jgi:uncharacterized protein YndB with AHSA1/START domain